MGLLQRTILMLNTKVFVEYPSNTRKNVSSVFSIDFVLGVPEFAYDERKTNLECERSPGRPEIRFRRPDAHGEIFPYVSATSTTFQKTYFWGFISPLELAERLCVTQSQVTEVMDQVKKMVDELE